MHQGLIGLRPTPPEDLAHGKQKSILSYIQTLKCHYVFKHYPSPLDNFQEKKRCTLYAGGSWKPIENGVYGEKSLRKHSFRE